MESDGPHCMTSGYVDAEGEVASRGVCSASVFLFLPGERIYAVVGQAFTTSA
jgi:hypothetical protein